MDVCRKRLDDFCHLYSVFYWNDKPDETTNPLLEQLLVSGYRQSSAVQFWHAHPPGWGGISEAPLGLWMQQKGPFLPSAAQESCSESPLNQSVVHGELQAPRSLFWDPHVWGCRVPGLCSQPQSPHRLWGAAQTSLQGVGRQMGRGIGLISVSQGTESPSSSSVVEKSINNFAYKNFHVFLKKSFLKKD